MKKVAILFIVLLTSSFVFAQNTYVPDDKFEQALIDLGYDTTLDDSVLTANISSVSSLDLDSLSISDLTGIEGFTALTYLECTNNQLTSLDVSKNTALTKLQAYNNLLTSVDLSTNTALTYFSGTNNQLTTLDLTNNTVLDTVYCRNNQLATLDVSTNNALIKLNIENNKLTTLDLSGNTALTFLDFDDNQLTTLDVSNNTALIRLMGNDNQLTTLDVSTNNALIELNIGGNQLTALDVSKNTALENLKFYDNQLTALDVSSSTGLLKIGGWDNALASLDVSNNTALIELNVNNNSLTSLDVSKNTALTKLTINQNQLTSLDVSKNTTLETLHACCNKLTSLDVSRNTALANLNCNDNQLTSLNIRNGVTDAWSAHDWSGFNATNNPNLTCIEVLDPAWATANWTSVNGNIDASVTFTYICGVDVDGVSTYNNNGIKAITFNVELPTHSLPDTNISLAFWKSGAESNECTGCNGRDTVSMRKLSDDHWEATVGLDTTLVAGDIGESMYWYHYVKTIPDYKINEDSERFKSEPNPDGLRQLEPGWHKETPLVNKDTVIAWNNIAPESFEWISDVLDTVIINKDNITDTYNLQWAESKSVDLDSIHYLVYAKIGVYPVEEIYDTTVTTLPLTYQEFLENVFEETPGNGVTVKFSVSATDGKDTVKVSGDDRVVYVNRYEYLSTESEGIPTEFALHENYPNPFNPTTTLRFDLPEVSSITLTIYNMLGQKVRTFNMNDTPAGFHSIKWNAINDYGDPVGAGVYLYQLRANQYLETRKMVLLK